MTDIYGEGSNKKRQWNKLKDAPLKEKVRYIVMYYGIAIIAAIGLIIFIIYAVKSIRYNKMPCIISVETYSSTIADEAADVVMEKISAVLNADPSDYRIEITSSLADENDFQQVYSLNQKIFSQIATGHLDCVITTEDMLLSHMSMEAPESRAFYDLRGFIPDDLYNRLVEEGKIIFLNAPDSECPYGINLTGTDLYDTLGLVGDGNILTFIVTSKNTVGQKAFAELIYE